MSGVVSMSSFSCPHYHPSLDKCLKIEDVCVPGRPGCVLFGNSAFAVPWQERLARKRRRAGEVQASEPPTDSDGH